MTPRERAVKVLNAARTRADADRQTWLGWPETVTDLEDEFARDEREIARLRSILQNAAAAAQVCVDLLCEEDT